MHWIKLRITLIKFKLRICNFKKCHKFRYSNVTEHGKKYKSIRFESDKPAEIQLIKSKLDDANITNAVENNYLTFTTTPTATSLKVLVKLEDEKHLK